MVNSRFQGFASDASKQTHADIRFLQAPESFEGVVDDVDIWPLRPHTSMAPGCVVRIILKSVDAGLSTSAPRMLVHDEEIVALIKDPSDNENLASLLERMRERQKIRDNQVDRARPVAVTYIFRDQHPAFYIERARQLSEMYKEAFGAERAAALYGLLTPLNDFDPLVNPFDKTLDKDGEPVSEFWRMLKELRGLRFIVNAVEVQTKHSGSSASGSGKTYSHFEWVRSRD